MGQYTFYRDSFGDREAASEVAAAVRARYRELRLQPFVLLTFRTNDFPHVNAVDKCVELARSHPELVPPRFWGWLDDPRFSCQRRRENGVKLAV